MILSITRQKDEHLVDYMIRLYENKDSYNLNNHQIADLLNSIDDTSYDESRWRKVYQAWKNYYAEWVEEKFKGNTDSYNQHVLDSYNLATIELEKEKVRMRDQKREYNKLIRNQARWEHLKEEIVEQVSAREPINMPVALTDPTNKNEAMVIISDMHIGMEIDSEYNTYNLEVAKERLNKLKQRTYDKVKQEGITKLHVVNLGDSVHGLIHVSAMVDAEIGVIQQIITASNMFESFIHTFLEEGIEVSFKSVSGNHSRVSPNKSDINAMEENFEKLIPVILDKAFQNYSNYSSVVDKEGLITTEIAGQPIALSHGDLDKGKNAVHKLSQLTGKMFRYLFTGHVHHDFSNELGHTTHFGVGSMSGLDTYAISGRFSGRPSQKIIVFGEKDIEENITVYLD